MAPLNLSFQRVVGEMGDLGELGLDSQKPHHALDFALGKSGELRAGYPIAVETGEDRSCHRWSDG